MAGPWRDNGQRLSLLNPSGFLFAWLRLYRTIRLMGPCLLFLYFLAVCRMPCTCHEDCQASVTADMPVKDLRCLSTTITSVTSDCAYQAATSPSWLTGILRHHRLTHASGSCVLHRRFTQWLRCYDIGVMRNDQVAETRSEPAMITPHRQSSPSPSPRLFSGRLTLDQRSSSPLCLASYKTDDIFINTYHTPHKTL